MSLYNLLHGQNPHSAILLAVLGIDQERKDAPTYPENWHPYDQGVTPEAKTYIQDCIEKRYYTSGRFRDIYLNEDGSEIILYTRNGGGNRESYPHIFQILSSHQNYLRNGDDDFDCTYAYFHFSVPEEAKGLLQPLVTGEKPMSIQEKFDATMKEMDGMSKEQLKSDPRFGPVIEKFAPIFEGTAPNGTVIEV